MKTNKTSKLCVILTLLICSSCASTSKLDDSVSSVSTKKSYRKPATDYLISVIADDSMMERIIFDTILSHSNSNMVVFNVWNVMSMTDRNMIVVHVNNDFTVDTLYSNIHKEKIDNHIKSPAEHPLSISKIQALEMAKNNGLKAGMKPWKVRLKCYAGKRDDVRWSITNTKAISKSGNYDSAGTTMSIKIVNGEFRFRSWIAIH